MLYLQLTKRRVVLATACLTSLTCATGCVFGGDDDEEGNFAAIKPQDSNQYTGDFQAQPYGVSACDAHDGKLRGKRELRVFSTGEFATATYTRALARYYARHDLTFFTRYPTFALDMPYVIETDEARLESALRKRFPKVNFDTEVFMGTEAELAAIQAAAAELVMKPLLTFVQKYGQQDPSITNVILMNEIASTNPVEDEDAILAGLAISPELLKTLRETGDESAAIWQGVPLPATFNAMVFVDANLLRNLKQPTVLDLVIAHEFGHSGGLVHVEEESNLMTPTTGPTNSSCDQTLTDVQLERMATTFRVGPGPVVQALRAATVHQDRVSPHKAMSKQDRWQKVRTQLIGQNARPGQFLRDLLHPHEAD